MTRAGASIDCDRRVHYHLHFRVVAESVCLLRLPAIARGGSYSDLIGRSLFSLDLPAATARTVHSSGCLNNRSEVPLQLFCPGCAKVHTRRPGLHLNDPPLAMSPCPHPGQPKKYDRSRLVLRVRQLRHRQIPNYANRPHSKASPLW